MVEHLAIDLLGLNQLACTMMLGGFGQCGRQCPFGELLRVVRDGQKILSAPVAAAGCDAGAAAMTADAGALSACFERKLQTSATRAWPSDPL